MDGLSWLNYLHNELETNKRFLMMDGIQSLSVSVIGEHRDMVVWRYIKDHGIDAQIRSNAPNFLEDLEEFYINYGKLIESILVLLHYVKEQVKGIVPDSSLDDTLGIIFREVFVDLKELSNEQRNPIQIVEDVFRKKGIQFKRSQLERFTDILKRASKTGIDFARNRTIPTFDSLSEEAEKLIAQIDRTNDQIETMIELRLIVDYREFETPSESEFYHG